MRIVFALGSIYPCGKFEQLVQQLMCLRCFFLSRSSVSRPTPAPPAWGEVAPIMTSEGPLSAEKRKSQVRRCSNLGVFLPGVSGTEVFVLHSTQVYTFSTAAVLATMSDLLPCQ